MDRKFILAAFGYAIVGLTLGMYMAGAKDHGQHVTHAHIMLAGFVVSFVYGLCHRLWLSHVTSRLAVAQFYIHHAGAITLFIGLFLLYGNFVSEAAIDAILGIASFTVFVGLVLMTVLFVRSARSA